MSTPADALRAFLEPLLPGWHVQFGRWRDAQRHERYAVLRPMGGVAAGLVRRPAFGLLLVGAEGDGAAAAYDAALTVVLAVQHSTPQQTGLTLALAGEPVVSATLDGRPTAEVAINTITD